MADEKPAPAAESAPAAGSAPATEEAATPARAPVAQPTNRRQSFRIGINTPVVVEYSGGAIDGRGADFSDDCMLVLSEQAPGVEVEVTLRCTDDAGKQVTMHGRVLRHHAPDGKLQGFVIKEKR